jgi:hypothetical protein
MECNAAWIGLAGVVAGAAIAFGGSWFTAWLNRNTERAKWQREKLHEAYREALRFAGDPPNRDYASRDLWLNMLRMYHPQKGTSAFAAFVEKVKAGAVTKEDVIEMGSGDQRLQEGGL